MDESWIQHYDVETKIQFNLDNQGVASVDFLQKGATIKGAYYAN